jgi:hypothetical protein
MRKSVISAAVLIASAGWCAPAVAAAPVRVSVPLEFSFQDDGLSEECGFDVFISGEGFVTAALHETARGAGLEVDRQVQQWTYEAPSTGGSFTYLSTIVAIFDYPEGAVVGGPATVRVMGSFEHVPGGSAAAGRLVFESTIIDVSDDGIPIAPLGEPTTAVGSHPDGDLCAALS